MDRHTDALAARIDLARAVAPRTWARFEASLGMRLPDDPDDRRAVEVVVVTLGDLAVAGRELSEEEDADIASYLASKTRPEKGEATCKA